MNRKTSVTYCIGRGKELPMIRLRGLWLSTAGFPCGAQVGVAVSPGRLVLEVVGDGQDHVLEPERNGAGTYPLLHRGGEP